MKAKFLTIAMALFVGTLVTSCDKDDDNMDAAPAGISSENTDNSGAESDPGLSAGRMSEDMTIGGKYVVLKFVDRGQNLTPSFTGVTFDFAADNIMFSHGNTFDFKGVYGVDMAARTMKMHIEGNDLMNMISGHYRINEVTEDGKVYLVTEDGLKSVVFSKGSPKSFFSGPVPYIVIPGRR